jgi:hypothetical protein
VNPAVAVAPPAAPTTSQATQRPTWIAKSDENARLLLNVESQFNPEDATEIGVESADERVIDLTSGFRARKVAALRAAQATLEARRAVETDPLVAQDLAILVRAADLNCREIELDDRLRVHHWDVTRLVFSGMHSLLDDQVTPARRQRALARLRNYVGMTPGTTPLAVLAKADVVAKLGRPGLSAPIRAEVEKSISTTTSMRDGIEKLLQKYQIAGYEEPLRLLTAQLTDYTEFLRTTVLPAARTDFALPPPIYALRLEDVGVDIPQAELIETAHREFLVMQAELARLAVQVSKERGLPSDDYRDVIRALQKDQLVGDAILPHYRQRLAEIEAIIRREHLVTLPTREATMRLGTAAENAQAPAPHMQPPRLVGNTGERGEFILPLSMPAPSGGKPMDPKFYEFTYAAASWTIIAHEARPGHELQFDSMVERGVSLARARYAFNSTNAEGWGLYAESIILPFMPADGQLVSMLYRMWRAARAFLDPELQQGKWTFDTARDYLEKEVVLSPASATQEAERYTFRNPGQATSYFYGFIRLRALRREVEERLGSRFDVQRFHDAILGEGLLPPDLMRQAVLRDLGVGDGPHAAR